MAARLRLDPFAAQDERFLPALRAFHEPKKLAAIADKWKKDFRPWAREKIFQYLALPFDALGHEPIVKHLVKHAEEKRDDELMGVVGDLRSVEHERGLEEAEARQQVSRCELALDTADRELAKVRKRLVTAQRRVLAA